MSAKADLPGLGWQARVQASLSPDMTMRELLDRYLEELGERSSVKNVRSVRRYIDGAFGDCKVVEMKKAWIEAWIEDISKSTLSANMIHAIVYPLRASFRIAVSGGLIEFNPATDLRNLPPKRIREGFSPELLVLSIAEMQKLCSDLHFPIHWRLLWALSGFAGLRYGEASELRYKDLDLERKPLGAMIISRTWQAKMRRSAETKTRTIRHVPIHPQLIDPLLEHAWDAFEIAFHRKPDFDDLIVCTPGKEPGRYHEVTALRHFGRALTDQGMTPRRLHDLRHSFDSALANAGIDERTIEILTHPPRLRKGLDHYIHTSWERRCEAILAIKGSIQMELFAR